MKILLVAALLSLTACGVHTERVEPRQTEPLVEQQVVVDDPAPVEDYYYRLIMDGSNVICAETNEPVNFFKCTAADYAWLEKNGIPY